MGVSRNLSCEPTLCVRQGRDLLESHHVRFPHRAHRVERSHRPRERERCGGVCDGNAEPKFYRPYTQSNCPYSLTFVLRTAGDPLGYTGTVRAALRAVDDDPLVAVIQSLEQRSGSRPIGGEAEPAPPFPLVTAPVSMGIE